MSRASIEDSSKARPRKKRENRFHVADISKKMDDALDLRAQYSREPTSLTTLYDEESVREGSFKGIRKDGLISNGHLIALMKKLECEQLRDAWLKVGGNFREELKRHYESMFNAAASVSTGPIAPLIIITEKSTPLDNKFATFRIEGILEADGRVKLIDFPFTRPCVIGKWTVGLKSFETSIDLPDRHDALIDEEGVLSTRGRDCVVVWDGGKGHRFLVYKREGEAGPIQDCVSNGSLHVGWCKSVYVDEIITVRMEARLSDCFVTADGVALDENQRKSVASHFKDALKELIAKRTIVNPQLGMISKQRVVLDIHHLKIVSAT